jgi:hypothetical protein
MEVSMRVGVSIHLFLIFLARAASSIWGMFTSRIAMSKVSFSKGFKASLPEEASLGCTP